MENLDTFYQSKKWRGLLEILKNERVNEDGQIICEYCGKPIVRAYDVIGHHKVHLTEQNVNDYGVSLDPDNIALVHHRCHNYIHDKLGYSRREVFIVWGAPLSGKRTWVRGAMSEGDLVVDMDNIWQCVSGCPRYVKPNRLRAVVFAVRDRMLEAVRYRQGKWNNAYVIGGYPLRSERERMVRELGARDIFIDASREECISRLAGDEERDETEWTAYIDDWFRMYAPHTS